MKQLTKEQAIKISESEIWKDMTAEQIARFQLFQNRLCIPFDIFHEAIESALGRPVFTHEFGLNKEGLQKELLGECNTPSFQDIIDLIPAQRRILVGL